MKKIILFLCCLGIGITGYAQRWELLPFADFEQWTTRRITESGLVGGKTKTIYVVGPEENIVGNLPYAYGEKTPWSTSNVYAKVAGIVKASCSVQPEQREGGGRCCRLETKMDGVKVLGLVNVSVLVTGSMYLGRMIEPITSSSDPYHNMDMGIPFQQKPSALVLDYKCQISQNNYVMKYPGIGSRRYEGVQDKAEIVCYLQQRWEDANGNLYAKRIATMRQQLSHDVPLWQNQTRFNLFYGDPTKQPWYKPYMGLSTWKGSQFPFRAQNSKGEIVPIREVQWGTPEDTPTHLIVFITAGNQGAFVGTIGNVLWVDNLQLEYPQSK